MSTETTYEVCYASYTPDGNLWCEANSIEELVRQGLWYNGDGWLRNVQIVTKIERHLPVEEHIPLHAWLDANDVVAEEIKKEYNDNCSRSGDN